MTCHRCHGFIAHDLDECNPGNWVYCVNCGWRGDDPSIPVIAMPHTVRLVKLLTDERAQPMSAEHRANISAARRRYEERKRQQQEVACTSETAMSVSNSTQKTALPC